MITLFLLVDNIGKLPYTYKEIVQKEYPDFWNAASECGHVLEEWQNLIVKLLPIHKEQLPKSFDELENKESQTIMLNYLKLRSIYSLAEMLWEQINKLCHELAVENNEGKRRDVENTKIKLIATFEKIDSIPIIEIVEDFIKGFDKLHQEISNFDFVVLPMRYSDICGIVYNKGIQEESLWESALNSQDPTEPDITDFMETPDDNKLIRMY